MEQGVCYNVDSQIPTHTCWKGSKFRGGAALHGRQDLSFLTRDWTHAPLQWKHGVLTPGPPGKSQEAFFFFKQELLVIHVHIKAAWEAQI